MDSVSDSTMTFDKDGNCNYCTDALFNLKNKYFPNE